MRTWTQTHTSTHQPDNLSEFCLTAVACESEQHTAETTHVVLGSQGRADVPGGTELVLSLCGWTSKDWNLEEAAQPVPMRPLSPTPSASARPRFGKFRRTGAPSACTSAVNYNFIQLNMQTNANTHSTSSEAPHTIGLRPPSVSEMYEQCFVCVCGIRLWSGGLSWWGRAALQGIWEEDRGKGEEVRRRGAVGFG